MSKEDELINKIIEIEMMDLYEIIKRPAQALVTIKFKHLIITNSFYLYNEMGLKSVVFQHLKNNYKKEELERLWFKII